MIPTPTLKTNAKMALNLTSGLIQDRHNAPGLNHVIA